MLNNECFMYDPEKKDFCNAGLKTEFAKKYHECDELDNCPFAKSLTKQLEKEEYCKNRLISFGIGYKSLATGEFYKEIEEKK